ncbi:MAG: alcohol dehydrogenase catalytic domain-containing protein [Pseudomonadales bacterium]
MKAMQLRRLAELTGNGEPLELVEVERPVPTEHELLLRVLTCGVCHTELDEIEGRLSPPRLPIIPGHQVVAEVVERGEQVRTHPPGTRVGVGWIHHSDGSVLENLSAAFVATGCDVNGGYAEFMTVPARYAVPIPETFNDCEAAPLLCAGAIGYRALRLAGIQDGQPLGLCGFGASAHIVLQLARHSYPNSPVLVFARSEKTQKFALNLGATWAGCHTDRPPQPLQAIIDTTPAWSPVLQSLSNLVPGGRLVINAIRKETKDQSVLMQLSYQEHLWLEREIKSVANITRADIAEFLPIAAAANIRPAIEDYVLEDANAALRALKFDSSAGAKVLRVSDR